MLQTFSFLYFRLRHGFAPKPRALFQFLNIQKWPEHVCNVLTWKSTSCHNGVHFLDISTSRSGPTLVCFAHTLWLGNVLRTTTVCNLSSLIWPAGAAEKQCFATCLPFRAPGSSSFWLSLTFVSLIFSSLTFSFDFLLWLFPSLLFICSYCRKIDF